MQALVKGPADSPVTLEILRPPGERVTLTLLRAATGGGAGGASPGTSVAGSSEAGSQAGGGGVVRGAREPTVAERGREGVEIAAAILAQLDRYRAMSAAMPPPMATPVKTARTGAASRPPPAPAAGGMSTPAVVRSPPPPPLPY
jgi:hypothetical protein